MSYFPGRSSHFIISKRENLFVHFTNNQTQSERKCVFQKEHSREWIVRGGEEVDGNRVRLMITQYEKE